MGYMDTFWESCIISRIFQKYTDVDIASKGMYQMVAIL